MTPCRTRRTVSSFRYQDETCASILAYLNNPNAAGKTYCGNTKTRGTWKQVDCKEK